MRLAFPLCDSRRRPRITPQMRWRFPDKACTSHRPTPPQRLPFRSQILAPPRTAKFQHATLEIRRIAFHGLRPKTQMAHHPSGIQPFRPLTRTLQIPRITKLNRLGLANPFVNRAEQEEFGARTNQGTSWMR